MENGLKVIFQETEQEINEINKRAKAEISEVQMPALAASAEMFARLGWSNWSEEELKDNSQYSRLANSLSGKIKLVSIDYNNQSAEVLGTQVYKVSGAGCTCGDFISRRLPCKHMYFLAERFFNGEQEAEQLKLEDTSKTDVMEFKSGKYEVLGCCDKCRECTSAGHCLQTDDYYKQCTYRKNLESGKRFYGKSANDFNAEKYATLKTAFEKFSKIERETVYKILYTIACNYDTSAELMIELDDDLKAVAFNSLMSELGIECSTDILNHLKRLPLKTDSEHPDKITLSKIAKDLKIRDKEYNSRKKAIEAFQNTEALKNFILENYIVFTYHLDFVRYYQELCRDFSDYPAKRLDQIRENYDN